MIRFRTKGNTEMRVLILGNNDGGLYKFRCELLEELVKENEVYFCVPDGKFIESIKEIGCRFVPCTLIERHGINPIKELKLINFYKKILKNIKPDIVFTYTIKCNAYGGMACASLGIPYVANVTGLGTAVENGGLMQKITLMLYKAGLRKAQKVFFQNSENLDFMLNHGVVKGEYDLLPGSGVNLEQYKVSPYPSAEGEVCFLFVGRIMKDKGIEELLSAARDIRKVRSDVIVNVVGFCDEDYNAILEKAEEEGVIKFCGAQSDVRPFYRTCHCVILPSYHEGMANVMLEASSMGRPVITTHVHGCRETFDDGVTGIGCEAKDAQSLKKAMEKFLSLTQEQRKAMGLAAREKMEREFDRHIVTVAYMKEIHNVAMTLK